MGYPNLSAAISDLGQTGQLHIIEEEVDPALEMAAIHRRVCAVGGPALYFSHVKGSPFPAVSNLFGTIERARFLFRNELAMVDKVMKLKNDPQALLRSPFKHFKTAIFARNALPKETNQLAILQQSCTISDLPLIKSWPEDGGAFITLPLVYTEDPTQAGVMNSNLGMYRVQLNGNDYLQNEEVGLHYQIHRGIGIHHTRAKELGQDLKVTIFVGGPPANTLAAVMPLPEGISELTFAGLMNGNKFRYGYHKAHFIPENADFVITGTISPEQTKPEGPFGDHLGYYSLKHPFPLMKVTGVYHRKDAIWPFTVVGRPPQEDSVFGKLIHELTGDLIPKEIPGVKEVNAVDESGVHPLLFAIGEERYAPFLPDERPQELLTIANRILGTGQLSLAKYLLIATDEIGIPSTASKKEFLSHILERIDLSRDLHFHTNTTIDTLDYSGTGMNAGSKVVMAAGRKKNRSLSTEFPSGFNASGFSGATIPSPGILVLQGKGSVKELIGYFENTTTGHFRNETTFPMVVLVDDVNELKGDTMRHFLWITFTRSNPSHDIYGVNEFTEDKHWGCKGSLIIDARIKPHHAPVLKENPAIEARINRFFKPLGPL